MLQGPFAVLLLLLVALGGWVPRDAAAQESEKCVEERATAENRYLEGRFDEAVALLQQCLEREGLTVEESVQVYRLMGLAYMNKGDQDQARQAVRDLLLHVPAYQADPVQDPPSYTRLVDDVRQELEAQALPEVSPEEEEAVPVVSEEDPVEEPAVQPQDDQPEARPDALPPAVPVTTPIVTTTQRRPLLRTPKSWLLATGGAVVLGTAVALIFGGSSESSPGPPR